MKYIEYIIFKDTKLYHIFPEKLPTSLKYHQPEIINKFITFQYYFYFYISYYKYFSGILESATSLSQCSQSDLRKLCFKVFHAALETKLPKLVSLAISGMNKVLF